MKTVVCANLAVLVWGAGVARADVTITMRGGEQPPAGTVTGVDAAGVAVDVAGAGAEKVERVVLSWDRVAAVEGMDAAAQFAGVAETAWRARTRLARGDAPGAEPLLESLFTKYEGQRGATAGVVASGLLRCRLTRQAQAAAVRPWLALVASGEKEVVFDTPQLVADGIVVPAMVDAETGLAPALPPIWIESPAVEAMVAASVVGGNADASGKRAAVLGELYRQSAAATMGRKVSLPARPSDDAGAALVWDAVAATAGTKEERATARGALAARLSDEAGLPPQWMEAWCRVALGRSLVMDGDGEERLRGLVHLVHVPARLEQVSPYLAGVALVDVARAMERGGDADGAARVWRELAEKFPGHPALSLRGVMDTTGGGS